jgi:hypothetical protein
MKRLIMVALAVAAFAFWPASALAAPGPVTIPGDYVYEPALGVLNDYCTQSPDQPLIAHAQTLRQREVDFRGPCARHDMCYHTGRPLSDCHEDFRRNLDQQCDYTFGTDPNPFGDSGWRRPCGNLAMEYYTAVSVFGNDRPA